MTLENLINLSDKILQKYHFIEKEKNKDKVLEVIEEILMYVEEIQKNISIIRDNNNKELEELINIIKPYYNKEFDIIELIAKNKLIQFLEDNNIKEADKIIEKANKILSIKEFIHQINKIIQTFSPKILQLTIKKEKKQNKILLDENTLYKKIIFYINATKRFKEDIKAFSNLDNSKYSKTSFTISDILDYINFYKDKFSSLQYLDKTFNIKVNISIQDNIENYSIKTDKGKLFEIFDVILSNGAEELANKEIDNGAFNKVLEIQGYIEDRYVVFRIKDNGRGIENIYKIFELNYSTKKHRGGSGIGLAVAKKIATDLDIKLETNTKISKGSTFYIKIPLDTSVILSSNFKKAYKIIAYSNSKEELIKFKHNIEEIGFNIELFNKIDDKFYSSFFISKIVLVSIQSEEDIELIRYIRDNKRNHKIITFIDEVANNKFFIEAIKGRSDDIIIKPNDFYPLKKKINRYYNEEILYKELFKIKEMEIEELLTELEFFINTNNVKDVLKELALYVTNNKKYIIQLIKEALNRCEARNYCNYSRDIYNIFATIQEYNINDRYLLLKNISENILHCINNCKPEKKIYNFIAQNILKNITSNYSDKLKILFEFEKRIIGLSIKHYIQKNLVDKKDFLQTNSLHYLMTGISHLQNNKLMPILTFYAKSKKLLKELDKSTDKKILQLVNNINLKKDIDSILLFKDFVNKTSSLFSSFRSESHFKNLKNPQYIYFLLNITFKYSINIKKQNRHSIKINITSKKLNNKDNQIEVFENVLISAIYSIIENSIEAEAFIIDILLYEDKDNFCIKIVNNGKPIDKDIRNYIFEPFSTNKENHSGIGLYLTKKELEQIGYKIYLLDNKLTSFLITIPIIKSKQGV